jgi:hypothetical protein
MMRVLFILILSLSFAGALFAALYKWVDEEGNVHYGDCPPVDCQPEQIETAPPPSDKDIQRSRERAERLIQEQRLRDEARKTERQIKQKQEKQRKAELKKRCKVLRSRLFLLMQPGTLTITDDQGNIMRPSDEERVRMIRDIQTFIQENCE